MPTTPTNTPEQAPDDSYNLFDFHYDQYNEMADEDREDENRKY